MENFINRMIALKDKPVEEVDFNMGFFDQYQFDTFIRSLDRHSDTEVFSFLKQNLGYIANRILNKNWDCPEVLVSEKFFRNFTYVVSSSQTSDKPIDAAVRVAANKICYDYLTMFPVTSEGEKRIMELSNIVNEHYINQLLTIIDPDTKKPVLTRDLAANLALCRFSALEEKINVKRLNFFMCIKRYTEIFTVQNIVYIYEKLFDRVGILFKETMWEYYTLEQELDFGADFLEIYSAISLAVLVIINNLTMPEIETVINGYIEDWNYMGCPPTRFRLISLSADFSRIKTIVDDLEIRKVPLP